MSMDSLVLHSHLVSRVIISSKSFPF